MLPLIFYYSRMNRYSFNALAAAMDTDADLCEWPVVLARSPEELHKSLARILRRCDKAVVAFSVLTTQLAEIEQLVDALRARHGSGLIAVAGGPHVTADPYGVLSSGMDVVFRGEAEAVFPTLLKRLAQGLDLIDLAGVGWRVGDRLDVNPRALPVDVNEYASFSPRRGMFGPIEITRGCPFACSFCQSAHIFGTRPRHRTIESIVRQATTLGPTARRAVRLLSPNAFSYGSADGRQLNLASVSALLQALRRAIAPGDRIIFGYFPSEVRPEHVVAEALELVRNFADNDEIVIGAQSGSERMLAACGRGHTVAHVLDAVRTARRFGFKVIVDFIFGLPGETESDARETIAVMTEVSRLGARIHPHAFSPLPQTAFARESCGQVPVEVTQALQFLRARRGLYENQPRTTRISQREAVPDGG